MRVSVEEVSPSRRALTVEVPADRVGPKLEAAYRALGQRVSLPGFRKGRVPRALLEQRFRSQVREDVIRELIPESYLEALREAHLEVLGDPTVEEVSFAEGQPLRYRAVVDVKPPLAVKDYLGVPVTKKEAKVTDEEVEALLQQMRERAAEYVPMEGWPALKDDLCILDYHGTVNGRPLKGGRGSQVNVVLGSGAFLPAVEEGLVGAQKGETREVRVDFPDTYPRKELRGKRAVFTVTVREVKKKRVPALDDQLVKAVGGSGTLGEFREKVRADLLALKERERDGEMKAQILGKIAEQNPVEVPAALVEAEVDALVAETLHALAAQGARIRGLDEASAQNIRAKFRGAAERRVHHRLLLEAIGAQEGITVSDQELQEELERAAAGTGRSPAALREALEKEGRLAAVRGELLHRKTADLLLSRARVGPDYDLIQVP
ncbi:MAG TPA: trigger factor [Candidatus Methylomirabilis sp.]|jgi:trigger factor|nr:trigger factor [Candidatus Methylomirabilis sp.]